MPVCLFQIRRTKDPSWNTTPGCWQVVLILYQCAAHLACQPDDSRKQLKPTQLGKPGRDFPDWFLWSGKTYPKPGPHLLVSAHIKGHGRRKLLPFVCLSRSHRPVHRPVVRPKGLRHPFAGIRTSVFRILM